MQKLILIIEDEKPIVDILKFNLERENYKVIYALDGESGLSMALSKAPDLILLDVMLPGMDGFDVCRRVREKSRVPILMLKARDEELDKVLGLELGADDYITKPFGTSELLARIRTAMRHTHSKGNGNMNESSVFKTGGLVIDYERRKVTVDENSVHLTQNEYKIVSLLSRHAGKVLTHDYIIKEIWGPGLKGDNQILRVNMANIRRKLEKNPAVPEYILTEVGVGYRMSESEN